MSSFQNEERRVEAKNSGLVYLPTWVRQGRNQQRCWSCSQSCVAIRPAVGRHIDVYLMHTGDHGRFLDLAGTSSLNLAQSDTPSASNTVLSFSKHALVQSGA
jgi:hypothetical protein